MGWNEESLALWRVVVDQEQFDLACHEPGNQPKRTSSSQMEMMLSSVGVAVVATTTTPPFSLS